MRIALNYRNVDPNRGGAETYVADLTRSLVRRGHQVTLVAQSVRADAVPHEATILPVDVSGWTRSAKIWSFGENSRRVLEAHADRFDVTMGFINTWHHDVIIPQGGLRAGSIHHNAQRFRSGVRRWVYRWTKSLSPTEWKYDRIERLQYDPGRKAHVIAVSRLVAGHLNTYRGVSADRVHVVYNAIDPQRFVVEDPDRVRAETRAKYGLDDGDHVGLFVGHNFWLKGLQPLLEAMAGRGSKGKGLRLLVSGGGQAGPFRRMVDRLGLAHEVRILGFTPDIKGLFHAADFFVSPTYYDPCSLVVLEALACGLPVITTGCNGAGELVTDGCEGFVVPTPNHQAELIEALDAMTDQASRRIMARAARELGREQTFDAHVSRLERIFEHVVAQKKNDRVAGAIRKPHIGDSSSSTESLHSPSKESERISR